MRNRRIYVSRLMITQDLRLCCILIPVAPAYIRRRAVSSIPVYSVRSTRIFTTDFLQPAITGRISVLRFPNRYQVGVGLTP